MTSQMANFFAKRAQKFKEPPVVITVFNKYVGIQVYMIIDKRKLMYVTSQGCSVIKRQGFANCIYRYILESGTFNDSSERSSRKRAGEEAK